MKKENVLVVALIVIAMGGIYAYNALKSPVPSHVKPAPSVNASAAALPVDAAPAGPGIGASDPGHTIDWKDYTPGMALARQENKNVFLYFHAPWCTYCVKLKQTTFKDKAVLAYLKENFISIQVNTDENQALATQWRVKGLPTMWFLEPDGGKIDRMPGYIESGRLLKVLEFIRTQSYTTMEFQEYLKQG